MGRSRGGVLFGGWVECGEWGLHDRGWGLAFGICGRDSFVAGFDLQSSCCCKARNLPVCMALTIENVLLGNKKTHLDRFICRECVLVHSVVSASFADA